ncbi:TMAO reductase system periplasmic protein TorT [Micromonospora sp. NPDC049679]|uniref:TMAO reductase system periplasmic protein TorT n=1 Tax=Micromonospora sp. NPDC049679 TaxID=3155920 RepID=UPI0033FDFF81
MPKGKAKAAALATAAALLLSACSVGQDSRRGESRYDPSQPVPGSDKGSFTASAAEIRASLRSDAWWYPTLYVDCADPGTTREGCNGPRTEGVYNAIPKDLVSNRWRICFAMPHVSDPYWVAADYGAVQEARRLGVELDVYEAGGYTELSKQLNQIDDCVASGAEAIVIGAISFNGLDAKVEQLIDDGIVVIDGLNGISSDKVSARAVLNWREMGAAVGDYLKKQNKTEKVAWFPGPPGAGWAEDATSGFTDAIKGSPTTVAATKYGDTSKEVQLKLLEDTVQADPGITVLAGTAVTADAAVAGDVAGGQRKIFADYLIPSTFDEIKNGNVTCGVSDQPVMQARIAIDMAVRLLEKIPLDDQRGRAFPAPLLVCGPGAGEDANLDSFIPETTFAPADFKPVFRVSDK